MTNEKKEPTAEQQLADDLKRAGAVQMKFKDGVRTPSLELSEGPYTATVTRNGNKPVAVPVLLAQCARRSGLLEDAPAEAPKEEPAK